MVKKNKFKSKEEIANAKLLVKRFGSSSHIVLPKFLIGENVMIVFVASNPETVQ